MLMLTTSCDAHKHVENADEEEKVLYHKGQRSRATRGKESVGDLNAEDKAAGVSTPARSVALAYISQSSKPTPLSSVYPPIAPKQGLTPVHFLAQRKNILWDTSGA
jgi:hypothetical protein